ncbi:hypothetical protein [Halochromatium salexigens]|uniref:Uncharacterized protein n=1 Tax=Halochromatium salexigens TaxID=49447 RepID=A0AAJ0UHG3_HALSE|nr:hypothetical protein [Halochromatium salexigens]MBK5931570.1 hypothetical protein [Halochromatium salexigens]
MAAIERLALVHGLRGVRRWLPGRGSRHARALERVRQLPAYQVALWPDGWDFMMTEGLLVRETHEMAEARRWYAMAARNGVPRSGRLATPTARTMGLYGIGFPEPILDLVGRQFASEQAASVAVRLIAGEWVEQRRRMLAQNPIDVFALQQQTWCGSRHPPPIHSTDLCRLAHRLLELCATEGLLPPLDAEVDARVDTGYGLATWYCQVKVGLRQARSRYGSRLWREPIVETLELALIPWNRAVLRDGRAWRLLRVEVLIEDV